MSSRPSRRPRRETFAEAVRVAVLERGAAIMGVCNVTPDSFSDGGRFATPDAAFAHVDALIAEGADVVDIGGESTRPGAKHVAPAEQIARIRDVVRYAATRTVVSVDTTSAEVAGACLDAGAHVVNDVSLLSEPDLAGVVAASGAALVLSHARGLQERMQGFGVHPLSAYDDVVRDVLADWERAAAVAMARGLPREALVMDPGLGFTKASRHSFELLRRTRDLVAALDVPVLVGASRKSFLTLVDPEAPPAERSGASLMAAVYAARAGARIVRVHDVRATRQALAMDVVLGTPPGHAGGTHETPLGAAQKGRP